MKRVLLKLSGEALAGEKHTGFDEATCLQVAEQVKQVCDSGVQVARRLPTSSSRARGSSLIALAVPALNAECVGEEACYAAYCCWSQASTSLRR